MKIKPIIHERIIVRHTNYIVDLRLDSNVTFITGNSGVGKSAIYSFMQEYSSENKEVRCYNYLDNNKSYKNAIKKSKKKLFIIDNADILLDNDMRRYIALDTENQYIIIGRNPAGLLLSQDEIYELDSKKEDEYIVFSLKKAF